MALFAASLALRMQLALKSRRASAVLEERKESAPEVLMVAFVTREIAAEFFVAKVASSLNLSRRA